MTRLTQDFINNGLCGHLAIRGDTFYFVSDDLPPIHIPRNSATLGNLSNADIIKFELPIPCRESRAPGVELLPIVQEIWEAELETTTLPQWYIRRRS